MPCPVIPIIVDFVVDVVVVVFCCTYGVLFRTKWERQPRNRERGRGRRAKASLVKKQKPNDKSCFCWGVVVKSLLPLTCLLPFGRMHVGEYYLAKKHFYYTLLLLLLLLSVLV